MFTGIVQGKCLVTAVDNFQGGRKLKIKLQILSDNLKKGASVSVNGVCLTVVALDKDWAEFDIIQESLDKSNLGDLIVGDLVNIERACSFGDEVGGHSVTGHVDCKGIIKDIHQKPNNYELVVSCEKEWIIYLIPKGWISIDGVSLTVVDVGSGYFNISLIPETLSQTVLGKKTKGDIVNLEFDHTTKVIVHTVERMFTDNNRKLLRSIAKLK